jgi:hypothetical protein
MMQAAYGKEGMFTPEKTVPSFVMSAEDGRRVGELLTPLKAHIGNTFADMVLGRQSVETDWDAYLAALDTMGWQEYLDIWQKALDKANKTK